MLTADLTMLTAAGQLNHPFGLGRCRGAGVVPSTHTPGGFLAKGMVMDGGNLWLLIAIALLSFVLALVGAQVGLILGHLRLPLLIAYLGNAPAGAATNLVTSGVGALAGTARHLREGRVSWYCLALMGIPSALGAVLGAYLFTRHISHVWSYLVIGVMLVVAGVNLIRPSTREEKPVQISWDVQISLEAIIGLGLGALAAVTGLMLGSLRLPMLMRFLKLDPKVAVGSNMAIGCLTAVAGAATTFSAGTDLPWERMLTVLAAVGSVPIPPYCQEFSPC
jgi:uncharacterized membrane protein YfcA